MLKFENNTQLEATWREEKIMKNILTNRNSIYNSIVKNPNNKIYFYAIITIISVLVYHSYFVLQGVPAQTGWWQYYGWRLTQGDVLYNDVYCYLPPYFPWLMGFLYSIFQNKLILYMVLGMIIRILTILILYFLLVRITKPHFAFIGIFTGECVNASFFTDQAFDYNPIMVFIIFLCAYLLVLLYESNKQKQKLIFLLLIGICSGTLFMMKQNIGLAIPFACVVSIFFIAYLKEKKYLNYLLLFALGNIISILPGYIYLLYTNSFSAYLESIIGAVTAKGSSSSMLNNYLTLMYNRYDIIIAISLSILVLILTQYTKLHELEYASKSAIHTYIAVAVILSYSFAARFSSSINTFFDSLKSNPVLTRYLLAGLFLVIVLPLWYNILINKVSKKQNLILHSVLILGFIFAIIFWGSFVPFSFHDFIYQNLNVYNVKRYFIYICFYFAIIYWFYYLYNLIIKKRNNGNVSVFIFYTIIMAMFGASIASAIVEEVFALSIWALLTVFLLNLRLILPYKIKNYIITVFSIMVCCLCLSQKFCVPYYWHGWQDYPIKNDEYNYSKSTLSALEGFSFPDFVAEDYNTAAKLILENTTEDDEVFQFANIPLFNILTERKISGYMPIHYFDVCPDDIAKEDAKNLYNDLPKMVVWDEMGENSWYVNEYVFRGGARSGQRDFQDFYQKVIKKKYKLLYSFSNNTEVGNEVGKIEIWLLNETK